MFWERFVSGVILLAVTITIVAFGGIVLLLSLTAVSLIGLYELYRTSRIEKNGIAFIGYLSALIYYFMIQMNIEVNVEILLGSMLCLMTWYVFCYPKYHIEQVTLILFGLIYVVFALSCIYHVRMLRDGIYLVWLIFIGAWGSDTCAYCVGKLIGKHKLPSELSPKKSIEGCVGGIAGAALIGWIYGSIFRQYFSALINPPLILMVIGGASSVISQIGDLAASAIKRNHNIKDYGHLIPGHGGILDRFDSIIFTAPLVYMLVQFFISDVQ